MIEDALRGAIIGLICGLIVWLFNKFRNKKSDTKSEEIKNSSPNLALLGIGGIMNDRKFPLFDKSLCIGTDPSRCAIVYPSDTSGITPLHCQLIPQNGGWLLINFSENGTWLGNERLKNGEPYILRAGDVFYLADRQNSFCIQEVTS